MPWDQCVILTCGVSGVLLAQTGRFQKYAPIPGLLGQIGWFHSVSLHSQTGIWLTCVVYCLAWTFGLWKFWIAPWLATDATATVAPGTAPRGSGGTTTSKPKLRLVK